MDVQFRAALYFEERDCNKESVGRDLEISENADFKAPQHCLSCGTRCFCFCFLAFLGCFVRRRTGYDARFGSLACSA